MLFKFYKRNNRYLNVLNIRKYLALGKGLNNGDMKFCWKDYLIVITNVDL